MRGSRMAPCARAVPPEASARSREGSLVTLAHPSEILRLAIDDGARVALQPTPVVEREAAVRIGRVGVREP